MATLTPQIAQENNRVPNSPVKLPEVNGVVVVQVLPNTPAAAADVRPGDVIVEIEGRSVTTAGQLQDVVEDSRVGQVLRVKVKRGNQTQQLAVRTAELQNTA